jgi:hypothetical protein
MRERNCVWMFPPSRQDEEIFFGRHQTLRVWLISGGALGTKNNQLPNSLQFVSVVSKAAFWVFVDSSKCVFSASRTNRHVTEILICSY